MPRPGYSRPEFVRASHWELTRVRSTPEWREKIPVSKMCEEKTPSTEVYRDATERFSHSVNELREKVGKSPKEEYERLRRASEEWRVHSEQARLALEQHVVAHKC